MITDADRGIVVVAACDPNLDEALFKAVNSIYGGDATRLLRHEKDWADLPANDLFWAFVDADLVNHQISDRLRSFQHVVLFNCQGNEDKIKRLTEPIKGKPTPAVVTQDHLLTEALFRSEYGAQIAPIEASSPLSKIYRIRSIPSGHSQSVHTGPVLKSEGLTVFLNALKSGITHDYAVLSKSVVMKTSRMKLPSVQNLLKIPPSELKDAADDLRVFAADPNSARKGCFLIGKKGVGKSTLAYYVGRTLDHEKKVCCIGVDYTMEIEHPLHARLEPLLTSFEENYPGARNTCLDGFPHTSVFTVRKILNDIIDNEKYHDLLGMSREAESIILLEADRGLITQFYTYRERSGVAAQQAFSGYEELSALVSEAESWYEGLRYTPKKLFILYLHFLINKQAFEGLASFTYRSMVRYMLSIEEHTQKALSSFQKAVRDLGLSPVFSETEGNISARQAILGCLDMPLPILRDIVVRVMADVCEERLLLLLLDNLDQRTSPVLEARGIYGALQIFDDQISAFFPNARAIVAMRDKTLSSQKWARMSLDLTRGWSHVHIPPPDLLTVLERRCQEWQLSAENIAGPGWRESKEVVKWVTSAATSQKKVKGNVEHDLLEIIEHRHPFNVREQLRSFTNSCENVFLHREWLKSREMHKLKGGMSWPEKSYEFFLRVFLLGKSRFFSEEMCELPNIYDNESPQSPFNACLRSWLLARLDREAPFEEEAVIKSFTDSGIPMPEVENAIHAFEKYHIIYPLEEDRAVLSIWGDYFRKGIAYDLPYISAVWWTTSMLEPYSLGDARECQATELRDLTGRFLRWLRREEMIAQSALTNDAFGCCDIFMLASDNIAWSLRNIEKSLDMPMR